MKVRQIPFLISLALLVILIGLSPTLFLFDRNSATAGSWIGLLPGFGLGTVLATCTSEDQATSRGLLFVPLAAALGLVMAITAWSITTLAQSHALGAFFTYALVNSAGVYGYTALIRYIYAIDLSYTRAFWLGLACASPAIILLFLPVSLLIHGIISAIWVALFGMGIAKFSGQRKRSNRKKIAGTGTHSHG